MTWREPAMKVEIGIVEVHSENPNLTEEEADQKRKEMGDRVELGMWLFAIFFVCFSMATAYSADLGMWLFAIVFVCFLMFTAYIYESGMWLFSIFLFCFLMFVSYTVE